MSEQRAPEGDRSDSKHVPNPDEPAFPELELDETIPPRPEEEVADVLRAIPDVDDHRGRPA